MISEPTGVVKIENSNGPRTESCGTPVVIETVEERRPTIDTNCDRPARCELSHCRTVSSKPNSSLARTRSRRWLRVSNAALMSSDSNTDGVLLSVVGNKSLTTLVIAVSVECSARYAGVPHWLNNSFSAYPCSAYLTLFFPGSLPSLSFFSVSIDGHPSSILPSCCFLQGSVLDPIFSICTPPHYNAQSRHFPIIYMPIMPISSYLSFTRTLPSSSAILRPLSHTFLP